MLINTCIPGLGQKCWVDATCSLLTHIQRGSLRMRLVPNSTLKYFLTSVRYDITLATWDAT